MAQPDTAPADLLEVPVPCDEPQPVGPDDLGDLLGVTRARAYQLRGKPDFPQPRWRCSYGPLWDARDIIAYGQIPRRQGRPPKGDDTTPAPEAPSSPSQPPPA